MIEGENEYLKAESFFLVMKKDLNYLAKSIEVLVPTLGSLLDDIMNVAAAPERWSSIWAPVATACRGVTATRVPPATSDVPARRLFASYCALERATRALCPLDSLDTERRRTVSHGVS